MENLFDNLFPITDKKYGENNKVIKLEMEVEQLKLSLKMAQTSNMQRKKAMDIMLRRLEQQKDLLDKFNKIMKEQHATIIELENIIDTKNEQLEHLERIDNRMKNIHEEQSKIIQFSQQYKKNSM